MVWFMNTRFLETFLWLAKLGNFSKTAEKLHATQPAISSRINALEDSLGVELYLRGSRPLELTPEGKQVLEYAETMLKLEQEMLAVGRSDSGRKSVKIGVIEIVTVTWLLDFIEVINASHKNLVLEITTGVHSDLMTQLINNELDLVLSVGPVSDSRIKNVSLCNYELHWVANPAVFDIDHEIDVTEIAKLPIILTKANSSIYPVIRDFLMSFGLDYVFSNNQKIKFDCVYSLTTAVYLAKAGAGVMPLMPIVISDEIKSNQLQVIQVRERLPELHLTAFYRIDNGDRFMSDISLLAQTTARRFCDKAESAFAGY